MHRGAVDPVVATFVGGLRVRQHVFDDLHVLPEALNAFGVAPVGDAHHPIARCDRAAETEPDLHAPVRDVVDRQDLTCQRGRVPHRDLRDVRRDAETLGSLCHCSERRPEVEPRSRVVHRVDELVPCTGNVESEHLDVSEAIEKPLPFHIGQYPHLESHLVRHDPPRSQRR